METPLPSPEPPPAPQVTQEERIWAAVAHAGAFVAHFIVPLAVWLAKRESSEFVADQAKEALNMQISYLVYGFVAGLLCLVLIGFVLLPLLGLAWMLFVIVAAISAYDGKRYRYPAIFRLIK